MATKNMTYRELLEYLKTLTESQLDQTARILIEDNSHSDPVSSIGEVGDDIYCHKDDDEDGGPLEDLRLIHGDEFVETDYYLCTPKDRIFMYSTEMIDSEIND